jgi:hypothetical protein
LIARSRYTGHFQPNPKEVSLTGYTSQLDLRLTDICMRT